MRRYKLLISSALGVIGAHAGASLGIAFACAKMLGDAEIYPVDALPPAPNLFEWMGIPAAIGFAAGICTGFRATKSKSGLAWIRRAL